MKVYIPTSKTTIIQEVLNSIEAQDLFTEIIVVNCNFDKNMDHNRKVALAKELCKNRAIKEAEEFFIIHDSDIVNLFNDNYGKLYSFMIKNSDHAIASLRRKNSLHVCDSSAMFRKSMSHLIEYNVCPVANECSCDLVANSAKKYGFSYDYIDEVIRIKHL
jgi:hypothetical protein